MAVELNRSVREGAQGWTGLMDNSLFSDLLSTTASNVSSVEPIAEPAFLISLVSVFGNQLQCCSPSRAQQSALHLSQMTDIILLHTLKDLGFLKM